MYRAHKVVRVGKALRVYQFRGLRAFKVFLIRVFRVDKALRVYQFRARRV